MSFRDTVECRVTKRIATVRELTSDSYQSFMSQLNRFAIEYRLRQYTTYSRVWEYPWVWFRLQSLERQNFQVLDIGSESSPFPWFLTKQGFSVTVSDVTAEYWQVWQGASRHLGLTNRRCILDAQNVDLPTSSVDIYLSVSVIEHVPNKAKAIMEAGRVLQPGGLLVMTFDICEPDMGMTFPSWNGRALTMNEFDNLFRNSPWFEPGLSEVPWNTDEIPEYLSWHRKTAPHHNYITGAAIVRRNNRIWVEPAWRDNFRVLKGKIHTASSVAIQYMRHIEGSVRHKVG